jgi:N4-gp56 family major capsid protein
MSSTSNLSTDTGLIQEYYERKSLETRIFENGLLKYAKRSQIPKHNSKVAHYWRWDNFGLADVVNEATEPSSGVAATGSEVIVQMRILSKFIDIPKEGDDIRLQSLIEESYPRLTEMLERTANRYLITDIAAGGSVGSSSFSAFTKMYAGQGTGGSFGALTANSQLTAKDLQRAVSKLEKNGAPKVSGHYMIGLSPWGKEDVLLDDAFRSLFGNQVVTKLEKGEIAEWAGSKIYLQQEPFREILGGTEGTFDDAGTVMTCYVHGAEAYGVNQLMGASGLQPKFKVQDITRTGSSMSVGFRTYFGPIVLNANFGIQLKHVASNA